MKGLIKIFLLFIFSGVLVCNASYAGAVAPVQFQVLHPFPSHLETNEQNKIEAIYHVVNNMPAPITAITDDAGYISANFYAANNAVSPCKGYVPPYGACNVHLVFTPPRDVKSATEVKENFKVRASSSWIYQRYISGNMFDIMVLPEKTLANISASPAATTLFPGETLWVTVTNHSAVAATNVAAILPGAPSPLASKLTQNAAGCVNLAASGTCQLSITASNTFTSPVALQTIAIRGQGAKQTSVKLGINSDALTFPSSIPINNPTPGSNAIQITNKSTTQAKITAIKWFGTPAPNVGLPNPAAAASCQAFTKTTAPCVLDFNNQPTIAHGTGTVRIEYSLGGSPVRTQDIALGVATTQIQFQPGPYFKGNQVVVAPDNDTPTKDESINRFQIKVLGPFSWVGANVALSGGSSQVALDNAITNNCSGSAWAPNATCNVRVKYTGNNSANATPVGTVTATGANLGSAISAQVLLDGKMSIAVGDASHMFYKSIVVTNNATDMKYQITNSNVTLSGNVTNSMIRTCPTTAGSTTCEAPFQSTCENGKTLNPGESCVFWLRALRDPGQRLGKIENSTVTVPVVAMGTNEVIVNKIPITYSKDLYAGGEFTSSETGDDLTHIARWDGKSWNTVGSGAISNGLGSSVSASDAVYTLVVYRGDLVAGGAFTNASVGGPIPLPIQVNNIAKWDGQYWNFLGLTLPISSRGVSGGDVRAITNYDKDGLLYVGGSFTQAGGATNTKYIANWNPVTNTWSGFSTALDNQVLVLASYPSGTPASSEIYVGGDFSSPGAGGFVKWNVGDANWTDLSGNIKDVKALTTGVYSGKENLFAGGASTPFLVRLESGVWSAISPPFPATSLVNALTFSNNTLYVSTGQGIGLWSGAWDPSFINTFSVGALQFLNFGSGDKRLYVGGSFSSIGGEPETKNIAYWNGTNWIRVSKPDLTADGLNNTVHALLVVPMLTIGN